MKLKTLHSELETCFSIVQRKEAVNVLLGGKYLFRSAGSGANNNQACLKEGDRFIWWTVTPLASLSSPTEGKKTRGFSSASWFCTADVHNTWCYYEV